MSSSGRVPFGTWNRNRRKSPSQQASPSNDDTKLEEPHSTRRKRKVQEAIFGSNEPIVTRKQNARSEDLASNGQPDPKLKIHVPPKEDDQSSLDPVATKPQGRVIKLLHKKKRKKRFGVAREVHLKEHIPPGFMAEDDDYSYDTDTPLVTNGFPKPLRIPQVPKPKAAKAEKSEEELEHENRRRQQRWKRMARNINTTRSRIPQAEGFHSLSDQDSSSQSEAHSDQAVKIARANNDHLQDSSCDDSSISSQYESELHPSAAFRHQNRDDVFVEDTEVLVSTEDDTGVEEEEQESSESSVEVKKSANGPPNATKTQTHPLYGTSCTNENPVLNVSTGLVNSFETHNATEEAEQDDASDQNPTTLDGSQSPVDYASLEANQQRSGTSTFSLELRSAKVFAPDTESRKVADAVSDKASVSIEKSRHDHNGSRSLKSTTRCPPPKVMPHDPSPVVKSPFTSVHFRSSNGVQLPPTDNDNPSSPPKEPHGEASLQTDASVGLAEDSSTPHCNPTPRDKSAARSGSNNMSKQGTTDGVKKKTSCAPSPFIRTNESLPMENKVRDMKMPASLQTSRTATLTSSKTRQPNDVSRSPAVKTSEGLEENNGLLGAHGSFKLPEDCSEEESSGTLGQDDYKDDTATVNARNELSETPQARCYARPVKANAHPQYERINHIRVESFQSPRHSKFSRPQGASVAMQTNNGHPPENTHRSQQMKSSQESVDTTRESYEPTDQEVWKAMMTPTDDSGHMIGSTVEMREYDGEESDISESCSNDNSSTEGTEDRTEANSEVFVTNEEMPNERVNAELRQSPERRETSAAASTRVNPSSVRNNHAAWQDAPFGRSGAAPDVARRNQVRLQNSRTYLGRMCHELTVEARVAADGRHYTYFFVDNFIDDVNESDDPSPSNENHRFPENVYAPRFSGDAFAYSHGMTPQYFSALRPTELMGRTFDLDNLSSVAEINATTPLRVDVSNDDVDGESASISSAASDQDTTQTSIRDTPSPSSEKADLDLKTPADDMSFTIHNDISNCSPEAQKSVASGDLLVVHDALVQNDSPEIDSDSIIQKGIDSDKGDGTSSKSEKSEVHPQIPLEITVQFDESVKSTQMLAQDDQLDDQPLLPEPDGDIFSSPEHETPIDFINDTSLSISTGQRKKNTRRRTRKRGEVRGCLLANLPAAFALAKKQKAESKKKLEKNKRRSPTKFRRGCCSSSSSSSSSRSSDGVIEAPWDGSFSKEVTGWENGQKMCASAKSRARKLKTGELVVSNFLLDLDAAFNLAKKQKKKQSHQKKDRAQQKKGRSQQNKERSQPKRRLFD